MGEIAGTHGNLHGAGEPQGDTVAAIGTLMNMIQSFMVTQVVHAAADLRLADHLSDGARTAEEVASLESSHPATTYRLMRACVALGLLAQDADGRFSATPMGQLLRSGVAGSLRDMALTVGAPGFWQPWGRLADAVRKGETQSEAALGMKIFDYYTANPAEGAAFVSGMSALTAPVLNEAVRVIDTTGTSLAVDVGAGNGNLIRSLMRANPQLRGLVFDLPRVVEAARQEAEMEGFGDRFSVQGGDFFDSVPEADLYLMKSILHDWDDDSCVRILQNCRKAARPDARLLVIETVILHNESFLPTALMDMNMLAVANGQERDLVEYDALFAAAGWKRVAVHSMNDPHSVIELRIVD